MTTRAWTTTLKGRMKDSSLRLQDKTVLLTGPFNGITQAILRTLTEFGCDVGYVNDQAAYASKYTDALNEARDVHPEYGRAAHIGLSLSSDKQIQEALGRIVESLGRMDALVDTSPLAWNAQSDPTASTNLTLGLAEKLIPFFLAKQRGRVIYLFEDSTLDRMSPSPVASGCREALLNNINVLAQRHRLQNVTVNAIALGTTDDFLLKIFPKSISLKKSFAELQSLFPEPNLKLVEFHDVGLSVAYLASALAAGVTGQVLRLTHGAHLAP